MSSFLPHPAKARAINAAAIIAATLNADILEIWTDVDGFMTADPRVINTAYTIKHLSYVEATELCNFGAKVVYPPTIYPVFKANIPIKIKNTFNPDGEGTIIDAKSEDEGRLIKGISSINDTDLLTVQGLGMVGVVGVNHRIFRALANANISVFLVSQASSETAHRLDYVMPTPQRHAKCSTRSLRKRYPWDSWRLYAQQANYLQLPL